MHRSIAAVLAVGALLLIAAPADAADKTLTVFAAASLHDAFTQLATKFEAAHPGVSVRLDFDGSQILASQIASGANADVFAAADQRNMAKVVDGGFATAPVNFAGNSLVVIIQFDVDIHSLRDLTRDTVKLAICAEAVPCGRYTKIALDKMSADPGFWPDYGKQVMRRVVTQEPNVEAVVSKVALGEVDAGFAYASDVAANPRVRSYPIPDADQELPTYPIATLKASAQPDLAKAFVAYVLSPEGQVLLLADGFRPHH